MSVGAVVSENVEKDKLDCGPQPETDPHPARTRFLHLRGRSAAPATIAGDCSTPLSTVCVH